MLLQLQVLLVQAPEVGSYLAQCWVHHWHWLRSRLCQGAADGVLVALCRDGAAAVAAAATKLELDGIARMMQST